VELDPAEDWKFTQALDFYLSEEGRVHLPEINRLAKMDTPEADEKILHYCMEGIRLNGTFGSYRESVTSMTVNDDGREVSVKPGDKVFVSFVRKPLCLVILLFKPDRILGRCSSQPRCFPLAKRGTSRSAARFIHSLRGGSARLPGQRGQPCVHHGHDEGGRAFRQPQARTRSARATEENPPSRRLLYLHETRSLFILAFSNQ